MKKSKICLLVGAISVALPVVACIIGMIIMFVIPGCNCDTGRGCSQCGSMKVIIELLVFGGFVVAIVAAVTVLPLAGIIGGIFSSYEK